MEKNEIFINMTPATINIAIHELKNNKKYLNLNKNIFSLEFITTCFNVEKTNLNSIKSPDSCYFKFSYNDKNVQNIFVVSCELKNTTAYGFLKNNIFMDDNQLELLVQKIYNMVDNSKEVNAGSLNNDLYNEALIFVTSGINKEECKSIKDDFETKFEAYENLQKVRMIKLFPV
jgi:hypothetical protein